MPKPEEPMESTFASTPKTHVPDPAFEKEAEQAENEAVLERSLEGTFPTSDPPSTWAGPDIEPERPDEGLVK